MRSSDRGSPSLLRATLAGTDKAVGPLCGLGALAVIVYFLLSGTYLSTIFEDVLIYAIAAMGIDLLGGYGGLVSLGQAGFVGLGAYGVAVSEVHNFGPWASVGIAIAAVLAVAAVTAIVAVRVSGITYVIITLAIGQIMWGLSYQWTSLTGGDNGIPLGALPSIGPFNLSDNRTLWIATLVVFLAVFGLLTALVRSPFGLSLRGMKSNERRLRALGYRTGVQRYLGYVIASFLGGLAGILYAFANHLVSPSTLDFSQDGYLVLMVILGGLGSIWGPVLGSVIIVLFQQEVSIYLSRWQTLMGVVFIAAVIYTPDGVAGLLRSAKALLHRAATRATTPAYALAGSGSSGAALLEAPPGAEPPAEANRVPAATDHGAPGGGPSRPPRS